MTTTLRPRLDVAVQIDGQIHQVTTTLRDTLELRKRFKGAIDDEAEGTVKLVFVACERAGIFGGSYEEFVDAVEDMEIRTPPL